MNFYWMILNKNKSKNCQWKILAPTGKASFKKYIKTEEKMQIKIKNLLNANKLPLKRSGEIWREKIEHLTLKKLTSIWTVFG